MYIRQATKDDLDDIQEIHFAAFRDEPDMDYPFPHRRENSWLYEDVDEKEVSFVSCRAGNLLGYGGMLERTTFKKL